jgi:hypothetical protein
MKSFVISTILFFTSAALALGRVVSYEEVQANLFGSIQRIETCGSWSIDDSFGDFRVLKVYYAGQDMLFVDVVTLADGGSELKVQHGFTFSEINNDHAEIGLDTVSCKSVNENVIQIDASATNGHSGQRYKFSIVVDSKSKTYEYSDTITNKAQQ